MAVLECVDKIFIVIPAATICHYYAKPAVKACFTLLPQTHSKFFNARRKQALIDAKFQRKKFVTAQYKKVRKVFLQFTLRTLKVNETSCLRNININFTQRLLGKCELTLVLICKI